MKANRLKIFLAGVFLSLAAAFSFAEVLEKDLTEVPVKKGETLWGFSGSCLKDQSKWNELLKYNKLPPLPEQVLNAEALKVPSVLLKEECRPLRFLNSTGEAFFRRGNGEWLEAAEGTDIFPGDTVTTGKTSTVDLGLYNGEVFRLIPGSTAVFLSEKGGLSCLLGSGGIRDWGGRLVSGQVKAGPARADSEFSAEVKKDASVLVRVSRGAVFVEAKGKKAEVQAGFSCLVKYGAEPVIRGRGAKGK
ncbi:MAG: hypothetical protein COT17_05160 [Elusimicrobia bacterium CG08_land_8_20_14_0_20_51_18]|nr:MAG: hypothetical protein COT17_05160 [Elusimicrobia bacterium CG08_land_8_20_14_0_20_51_18]